MNTFIVLAHPERTSFSGALFDKAASTFERAGHTVAVSDLYRMGFNPTSGRHNFVTVKDPACLKLQVEETHATEENGFAPELEAEMRKVERCDLMILQFPLWWSGMPAILKGWVDRVLAQGRMYSLNKRYETGKFRGKRALVSLTTGGPEETYRKDGVNGDLDAILRPIHRGVLQYVGFDVLAPQIHYGPARASDAQRDGWLSDYARRLSTAFDESPINVGRY